MQPGFLVVLLRHNVAHDPESMGNGESDVDASPPSATLVGRVGVLPLDQMHKGRLVKQGKHAVEIFEIVFEKRDAFILRWQRLENASHEQVAEYLGLPEQPSKFFIFFGDGILDCLLERSVSGLLVDPFDSLLRKD